MTENIKTERKFLRHHYEFPRKPFSSDQHIMFVNAVEDYGLKDYERPNWINIVRPPIERFISLFYFFKNKEKNINPR